MPTVTTEPILLQFDLGPGRQRSAVLEAARTMRFPIEFGDRNAFTVRVAEPFEAYYLGRTVSRILER